MVFYEWVQPPRYGMLGRRFRTNGDAFEDIHADEHEQHVGVYETPFVDRIVKAALDIAKAVKEIFDAI